MTYPDKTAAAEIALQAHMKARGLDDEGSESIALYHLLDSLLTLCDARGIDFDAELSGLRSDLADDHDTSPKHPFRYDHTSLIGVQSARKGGRA